MMRALALALGGIALFAASALAQSAQPYFVREGMVGAINPPITAIWDMQVEVMDDDGNFDPALMDDAKWSALAQQASALEMAAAEMAGADFYSSHDPAGTLGDAPEGTDLAGVDARLAQRSTTYRAFASALADHSTRLTAAAEARDAAAVTRLVNDAQPVCKACHDVFWYPEEYVVR